MSRAKQILESWVEFPPDTIEEIAITLANHGDRIREQSDAGIVLRMLFKQAKHYFDVSLQRAQLAFPIAFWKPSYEQALMLNAWIWGVTFPICFASNRIGKTVGLGVVNAILWCFPNNPSWLMFRPYIDHLGRLVQVIPRPKLESLLKLQNFFFKNPFMVGDHYAQPFESINRAKFTTLQKYFPDLDLLPAFPSAPIFNSGSLWLGAPDHDWHRHIFMKRWKALLPKASILKWNTTECFFSFQTNSKTNPHPTKFEVDCKSYDSEHTKWSGDAVQGIMLTEGFTQDILNEVKQRIINNGFMSWDYTPAEPRNTGKKVSLAHKVYKGIEQLPLRTFIFTKFSVRNAPEHIIPKEKKADLIRMWDGKPEGKARIDGDFYASSGLVLDKLDRNFHCLNWTLEKLYKEYPDGRNFRGIDPGLDHPTACAWGYLSRNNIWFIYRFYVERGTTIAQRCKDIIRMSNNSRQRLQSKGGRITWQEIHDKPNSEVFVANPTDYHTFKEDENTGLSYARNYINQGLHITESVHTGPEERAQICNQALDPHAHPYLAHPERGVAPGARLFFLTNQPGVAKALDALEELFWDRYKAGDLKGEPKDKVPLHGDNELDGICNLVCGPYAWTATEPQRREPKEVVLPALVSPLPPPIPATEHSLAEIGFH